MPEATKSKKLSKAPLKEVMIEIHWDGETDGSGGSFDPDFDLMQGKFANAIKHMLPHYEKIGNAPTFGKPRHQYWMSKQKWPVVQHGPGILTINEVEENYVWDTFINGIVSNTIKTFSAACDTPLNVRKILLQYTDVAKLDKVDPLSFVDKNLQTKFLHGFEITGDQVAFNYSTLNRLRYGKYFELTIKNGYDDDFVNELILWTTAVFYLGDMSTDDIVNKLEEAHEFISPFFRTMISKEYYDSIA